MILFVLGQSKFEQNSPKLLINMFIRVNWVRCFTAVQKSIQFCKYSKMNQQKNHQTIDSLWLLILSGVRIQTTKKSRFNALINSLVNSGLYAINVIHKSEYTHTHTQCSLAELKHHSILMKSQSDVLSIHYKCIYICRTWWLRWFLYVRWSHLKWMKSVVKAQIRLKLHSIISSNVYNIYVLLRATLQIIYQITLDSLLCIYMLFISSFASLEWTMMLLFNYVWRIYYCMRCVRCEYVMPNKTWNLFHLARYLAHSLALTILTAYVS